MNPSRDDVRSVHLGVDIACAEGYASQIYWDLNDVDLDVGKEVSEETSSGQFVEDEGTVAVGS